MGVINLFVNINCQRGWELLLGPLVSCCDAHSLTQVPLQTGEGVIMKTQGLNHIQIAVSDIDRSLTFYMGLLGMRELLRKRPLVLLQSAEGNHIFTLRQAQGPVDTTPIGLQHFGFAVNREDHPARQVLVVNVDQFLHPGRQMIK